MSKITPKSNYIVAKEYEYESATKSGIIIPDSAKDRSASLGIVVSAGKDTGYKADDVIIFKSYSSTDVKLDGQKYLLIEDDDIIGAVNA